MAVALPLIELGAATGFWGFVADLAVTIVASATAAVVGQKIVEGSRQETGADPEIVINVPDVDWSTTGTPPSNNDSNLKCNCHGLPWGLCPNHRITA